MDIIRLIRRKVYSPYKLNTKITTPLVKQLERDTTIEEYLFRILDIPISRVLPYRDNKDLYNDFLLSLVIYEPKEILRKEELERLFSFPREEWDSFLFKYVDMFKPTINDGMKSYLNDVTMSTSLGDIIFNIVFNRPNVYKHELDYNTIEDITIDKHILKLYNRLKIFNYVDFTYKSYSLFLNGNYVLSYLVRGNNLGSTREGVLNELMYYNYMLKNRIKRLPKNIETYKTLHPKSDINDYIEYISKFSNKDIIQAFKLGYSDSRLVLISMVTDLYKAQGK